MATVNMMVPAGASIAQTVGDFANIRQYSGNANGFVTGVQDYDAAQLANNGGWFRLPSSGTTAQRPAHGARDFVPGMFYYDTTLSKMIVCDGATWRDPLTGIAT